MMIGGQVNMNKKKCWVDPEVIDTAIRNVISELNEQGYETQCSCAGGHDDPRLFSAGGEERGNIIFARKYDHRAIERILHKHGLEDVEVSDPLNPYFPDGRTEATFEMLGGPSVYGYMEGREPEIVVPTPSELKEWLERQDLSDDAKAAWLEDLEAFWAAWEGEEVWWLPGWFIEEVH